MHLYNAETKQEVEVIDYETLIKMNSEQLLALAEKGSADFNEGWMQGSELALYEESNDFRLLDEKECCERFFIKYLKESTVSLEYAHGVWVGYVTMS